MSKDAAPEEFRAGKWTIEVSKFEPSTFKLNLESDGSVTGRRTVNDMGGPVSGAWSYQIPTLTLNLSSQLGLHPQPVQYEIEITSGDSKSLSGSDTDGHHFDLKRT
jgi:hypothetical protein